MSYQGLRPISGTPGDENTEVTMKSIKEILEAEGAAHLLMQRRPEQVGPPEEAPVSKPAPLRQLAEAAKTLQIPPLLAERKTQVVTAPDLQQADATETAPEASPTQEEAHSLLPRLFGRK